MGENNKYSALILGVFILLGLSSLGYLLGNAAIKFRDNSVLMREIKTIPILNEFGWYRQLNITCLIKEALS